MPGLLEALVNGDDETRAVLTQVLNAKLARMRKAQAEQPVQVDLPVDDLHWQQAAILNPKAKRFNRELGPVGAQQEDDARLVEALRRRPSYGR